MIFISNTQCENEFPLEEFFNISKDLSTFYMCKNQIEDKPDRCCKCNEDCMKYKTCCIDKLWNSTKFFITTRIH